LSSIHHLKTNDRIDGRSSEKKTAVITAATHIFLEQGFHNASMDAIARAAGVSKQTIYNNFGSKAALFSAIACERCLDRLSALLETQQAHANAEATLHAFAKTLLQILLEPAALALHRLIIAESARFPEVGEIYHRAGPERGIQLLAKYLDHQCQLQQLNVQNTLLAAQQFTGALIGSVRTRALALNQTISPAEQRRIVDYTVNCFMCVHGTP
jgi:AcrR family transcriptional regulator